MFSWSIKIATARIIIVRVSFQGTCAYTCTNRLEQRTRSCFILTLYPINKYIHTHVRFGNAYNEILNTFSNGVYNVFLRLLPRRRRFFAERVTRHDGGGGGVTYARAKFSNYSYKYTVNLTPLETDTDFEDDSVNRANNNNQCGLDGWRFHFYFWSDENRMIFFKYVYTYDKRNKKNKLFFYFVIFQPHSIGTYTREYNYD